MTSSRSSTSTVDLLRARGITNPEQLASSTTDEQIIASCDWYDKQANAKPGLLVWRIRSGGGVDEKTDDGPKPGAKRQEQRAAFAEIVQHFPEGSVTESHKRLQRRRDHEEDCDGLLVVVEPPDFPFIVVRCDGCGFEASYPFKALAAGVYEFTKPGAAAVLPARPPVESRPVPDPQPAVPAHQHRPTRDGGPRRLDERSLRWRR